MFKKRVVATLFLYSFLFIFSCDFKSPESWETPTWYLPLTVPLVNQIYWFDGMTQDSTIVEDSLNNTIKLIFSDNIVEPGGDRPGITDDIFNFEIEGTEQTDIFDQEFSIDKQPSQSVPDASILPPPIQIPLLLIAPDVIATVATGNCLPYENLSDFSFDTTITMPILSSFSSVIDAAKLNGEPIIKSLHKITVNNGKLGARVTNELPFEVTSFSFSYKSVEYNNQKRTLRDTTFNNIQINEQKENSDINITSNDKVQFGDSLIISFSMNINKDQLTPNQNVCSGILTGKDGWQITGSLADALFSIQLEILIEKESAENIICTTNPIVFDTTIISEFPSIDKIDIKGGKITEDLSTSSSNPPMLFDHSRLSIKSSTHNIEGVLIVDPLKISKFIFFSFLKFNNFGIGQIGIKLFILSTALGDKTIIP